MAFAYGYGELEDQIIRLLRMDPPDFTAAERLIAKGANLNASGNDPDENILSEILSGFWQSESIHMMEDDEFHDGYGEYDDECSDNEHKENYPEKSGITGRSGRFMVKIIRFFLKHGFDVHNNEDRYGAQCLYALVLSTFDANMIEATKLLLDAGAKNRSVDKNGDETPWDFIGMEGSYQDTCCHNHHLGNLYEAVYQIYQAVDEGRPYHGINSYEIAYGKRITRIFVEKPETGPIFFDMDLPTFKHENCFHQTLYFAFDGGYLISTQYAEFWVDTILPEKEMVDVSSFFPGIVGHVIEKFHFSHNEIVKGTMHYGQPITTIDMENGTKVIFSINFGEVKSKDRAAFFTLQMQEDSQESSCETV